MLRICYGPPQGTALAIENLIAELKRRRVFRVLVGYGVVSFAVLQVVEPIMHGLRWPDAVLGYVVVGLAVGFPVSVVLAWAFDVNAGRIERAPEPAPGATGLRGARLALVLLGIGVVAAAPGLAWYFLRGQTREQPGTAAGAKGLPSIAVLPFANLSSDKEQEYFSEGITEEITSKLSRLKGLTVAARTSVARFKSATQAPGEIGAALGVAWLLEGSVRRAGDRIRVTTTLLKAADGFRVWSDDSDAKLDDIFTVQEQIATRTVEALALKLTPDERRLLSDWGTRNGAAYEEYLHGLTLAEHFDDRDRLESGRRHFERALEIDRDFAPALAGLADVEQQMYRNFDPQPARLERSEAAARRALEIDPRFGFARLVLINLKAMRYDYTGAAEGLRPLTADEPRNYVAWDRLCWVLGYEEPPEAVEAERACLKALEVNPGYAEAYYHLARALVFERRPADADQAIRNLLEQPGTENLAAFDRFWLHLVAGRYREALVEAHDHPPRKSALIPAWSAMAHAGLGEKEPAFVELEEALRRGYRDVGSLRRSPWFVPLRADPRFDALLARYGVPAR